MLDVAQEEEHHHKVLHLHAADEVPVEADAASVAHGGANAPRHGHQQPLRAYCYKLYRLYIDII